MTPTLTPTRTPPEGDTKLRDRSTSDIDREFESLVFEYEPRGRSFTSWLAIAAAIVFAIALLVTALLLDRSTEVLDVSGSDVHLQNQADEIADQVAIPDVMGSDMHLLNLAPETVTTDVTGSDVHLQNLADEIAVPDVSGSDMHLLNLAPEDLTTDVTGSDVHLQNLADELAVADVTGSDVHLQNLADEIAGS